MYKIHICYIKFKIFFLNRCSPRDLNTSEDSPCICFWIFPILEPWGLIGNVVCEIMKMKWWMESSYNGDCRLVLTCWKLDVSNNHPFQHQFFFLICRTVCIATKIPFKKLPWVVAIAMKSPIQIFSIVVAIETEPCRYFDKKSSHVPT